MSQHHDTLNLFLFFKILVTNLENLSLTSYATAPSPGKKKSRERTIEELNNWAPMYYFKETRKFVLNHYFFPTKYISIIQEYHPQNKSKAKLQFHVLFISEARLKKFWSTFLFTFRISYPSVFLPIPNPWQGWSAYF